MTEVKYTKSMCQTENWYIPLLKNNFISEVEIYFLFIEQTPS